MESVPNLTPEENPSPEIIDNKENWLQRKGRTIAAGIAMTAATMAGTATTTEAQFSQSSNHSANKEYVDPHLSQEGGTRDVQAGNFTFQIETETHPGWNEGVTFDEVLYKGKKLWLTENHHMENDQPLKIESIASERYDDKFEIVVIKLKNELYNKEQNLHYLYNQETDSFELIPASDPFLKVLKKDN